MKLHFRRSMNISNFVLNLRNLFSQIIQYERRESSQTNCHKPCHDITRWRVKRASKYFVIIANNYFGGHPWTSEIQKRQTQHSSSPEIPLASSTNADLNNCLDRLENLVEELTNTVQKLNTSSNATFAQSTSSSASICDHCEKSGHNRHSWFKLKRECPLWSSEIENTWHMMKNRISSYFVHS